MARRSIPAGELGAIQITTLSDGRYRARARTRDDAGNIHQLRVVADTEAAARAELQRRVLSMSGSTFVGLTSGNTVAAAAAAWLEQIRIRAEAGSIPPAKEHPRPPLLGHP